MKKNYLEVLFRLHTSGVPISLRSLPSDMLGEKMNIIESAISSKGEDIYSYGASYISKDLAHAKCVAETVERLYVPHFEEGGVGVGFDKESVKLSALYELVERDAFMPYFLLGNVPVRYIDTKIVKSILKKSGFGRIPSNYTFINFDITNDLGIPSIATYMLKRGSGLMCVGIKSNADPHIALLGSMEEVLLEMTLKEVYGIKTKKDTHPVFSMKHFKSIFVDNKNSVLCPIPDTKMDVTFNGVYAHIHKRRQSIIFKEMVPSLLKNLGYYVITASSDTLQKVFFTSDRKNINNKRLENIKRYYTIMEQNNEKNSNHI